MSRIVVGVDGSPPSIAAVRWALDEAAARKATVHAVHAWHYPLVTSPFGAIAPAIDAATVASLTDDARAELEQALAEAGDTPAGVEVVPEVIEGGPAAVLIEAAKGADLLVVGSRGLGGFSGLLLGSVSHQCSLHAPCPVVIVRGELPGAAAAPAAASTAPA